MAIKLKDIQFFKGIDSNYINMIIDKSRRIEFKNEETILTQGDETNGSAYIIQEGSVRVEINNKEVNKINEGGIFGEIALITDEARIATVIAESDLILLKIDKELLHTIIQEFENGREIQKILMSRILENVQK